MKKVININFQGRVIPIEETAYAILKEYTESLRNFFANEEGRDEIINDIEGRIAELFNEELKKGAVCITDAHVNTIIDSMGRPEEFDGEETKVKSALGGERAYTQTNTAADTKPRGRLYRSDNDKILGGVCGGLASYLKIDPSIVRILFAILTFGSFGFGFLMYILLWVVLPSRALEEVRMTKRLFRNPEERMIAGVGGGIAAYFNINVWIPRLIFAAPIIMGIVGAFFNALFRDRDFFPNIVSGSFSATFFIVYAILWAVIPEANTASEKLEMRGEKVDLENIKNTIQEDLEQFKVRAEKWGNEFGSKVNKWGEEMNTNYAYGRYRSAGNRFGHAVGVIFKAIFLFIAGVVAVALVSALLGMLIHGVNVHGIKDYLLTGFWQNSLAWAVIALFIGIPILALIVWVVRTIAGSRKRVPFLGGIFGTLWTVGLISLIVLAALITKDFRAVQDVNTQQPIKQPSKNKMIVMLSDERTPFENEWFGSVEWDGDAPFYPINNDSIFMRNVNVVFVKSTDNLYHVNIVKTSNGVNNSTAEANANAISYTISQNDTVILLPDGLITAKTNKYRRQRVTVVVEVPVGKKIEVDQSIDYYNNYHRDFERNWKLNSRDSWRRRFNNGQWLETNKEYVMTEKGAKKLKLTTDEIEEEKQQNEEENEQNDKPKKDTIYIKDTTGRYRYTPPAAPKAPKPAKQATINNDDNGEAKPQAITSFDKMSLFLGRIS